MPAGLSATFAPTTSVKESFFKRIVSAKFLVISFKNNSNTYVANSWKISEDGLDIFTDKGNIFLKLENLKCRKNHWEIQNSAYGPHSIYIAQD